MAATLPTNLALVVKRLSNFNRMHTRIRPMTNDEAGPGQTVVFRFPSNTLMDLHNLCLMVDCQVTAKGKTGLPIDLAITTARSNGTSAAVSGAGVLKMECRPDLVDEGAELFANNPFPVYNQVRDVFLQLPIGAQTMINRLEVVVNGQLVTAQCSDYGYIYNILQYHMGHLKKPDEVGGGSYNHGWLTHQCLEPEEKLLMGYRVINPAGGWMDNVTNSLGPWDAPQSVVKTEIIANVPALYPKNPFNANSGLINTSIRGNVYGFAFGTTGAGAANTSGVNVCVDAPLLKRPNDDGIGNGYWLYTDDPYNPRAAFMGHGPAVGYTSIQGVLNGDDIVTNNLPINRGEANVLWKQRGVYGSEATPYFKPFVYLKQFTQRPLLFDNWLGFLGGDYVRFLDTAVTGPIEVRITLAPANILAMNEFRWENYWMTNPTIAAAYGLDAGGIDLGQPQWQLEPGWTYSFNNMYMWFDTVSFTDDFYRQLLARRLLDGGIITIPYVNVHETHKLLDGSQDTLYLDLPTQSLDYLISTLRYSSYNNLTRPGHFPPGGYNTWPYFSAVSGSGRAGKGMARPATTWNYVINNMQYPPWGADVAECEMLVKHAFDISGDLGAVGSLMSRQDFQDKLFAFVYCFKPHTEAEKIVSGLDTRGAYSNMEVRVAGLKVEQDNADTLETYRYFVNQDGSGVIPGTDAGALEMVKVRGSVDGSAYYDFPGYDINGNMDRKHMIWTYALMTSTVEIVSGQNLTYVT